MKVVIDIDDEMYKYICKHYKGEDTACLAIKNGLVLTDNLLYPFQLTNEKKTCKDCIHSGLCYKENDYENFPDRCGSFISDIWWNGYDTGKVIGEHERPQGEWKTDGAGNITCSNCGFSLGSKIVKLLHPFSFPYCPECGAKMRGDAE